ncbi:hypothetical protein GOV06_03830 [Candidatus Woesearchaeota archaeon]|nr:hypothetical protein [Candidatus Woesearchaeota archaeon]
MGEKDYLEQDVSSMFDSMSLEDKNEYDGGIERIAKEGPDIIEKWMCVIALARNPLLQHCYIRKMVDDIKKNNNLDNYVMGIIISHSVDKKHVQKELTDEMIKQYPIRGRIQNFWMPLFLMK